MSFNFALFGFITLPLQMYLVKIYILDPIKEDIKGAK